jgi:hypothetical protein
MTEVRISEDALADLDDGFWFYEALEEGLGEYFRSSLVADIERLKISAGIHPVVYQNYHRLLSRVFPFGIFYTLEESGAIVWAVIDLRCDPEWIRDRLNK